MNAVTTSRGRWYDGVTRYQWVVLAIASAGWVFDVFEGQIFVAGQNESLGDLLGRSATQEDRVAFTNYANAAFLLGGALGGVLFGTLADRIGRRRVMVYTILMYSLFTGLTATAQHWSHLIVLRFLVAMGVGGEWAVAAAAVAEVFPQRSRTAALGIFHASSVLGTLMAVVVGATIVTVHWRYGFLVGVAPALLVLWIRRGMREPESWQAARREAEPADRTRAGRQSPFHSEKGTVPLGRKLGSFRELFGSRDLLRNTLVGTGLAAIGMATFWGVHIFGKNLMRAEAEQRYLAAEAGIAETTGATPLPRDSAALLQEVRETHRSQLQRWDMLGMLLVTTGGGLGLLAFAPLAERFGRRGAFALLHVGAAAMTLLMFRVPHTCEGLIVLLPVFGFFTLGMHAGYAIYFPELFPTRLRGTGGGFCFNVGRIAAAPLLFIAGAVQRGEWAMAFEDVISLLGLLYLAALLLLPFAPETRGRPLPE